MKTQKPKSFKNKELLKDICGCYYCLSTFFYTEIDSWADKQLTALCPICGIDSVIPKEDRTLEQLEELLIEYKDHYFAYKKKIKNT